MFSTVVVAFTALAVVGWVGACFGGGMRLLDYRLERDHRSRAERRAPDAPTYGLRYRNYIDTQRESLSVISRPLPEEIST
ncbi:hypothetical protein [Nocardia sp. Marseille-Q1738]